MSGLYALQHDISVLIMWCSGGKVFLPLPSLPSFPAYAVGCSGVVSLKGAGAKSCQSHFSVHSGDFGMPAVPPVAASWARHSLKGLIKKKIIIMLEQRCVPCYTKIHRVLINQLLACVAWNCSKLAKTLFWSALDWHHHPGPPVPPQVQSGLWDLAIKCSQDML